MSWSPPLMSGPISPESNPPIEPQYFKPSVFTVSAIALGETTLVTTSVNHNYVTGQLTRLLIPQVNGSRQLNEMTSYVSSIPAPNQMILHLNSVGADTFIPSDPTVQCQPQIVPVGDVNTGHINYGRCHNKPFIPGSFRNISPY